jgi:polyisoprenoid-binding protein YceI
MTVLIHRFGLLLGCALLFWAGAASAQWQLDPSESAVYFVSVKNSRVGEAHEFKALSGGISGAGEARVTIELDSVETLIPIRNERMREMLFETVKFPNASVSTSLDADQLALLSDGMRHRMTLQASLSLHGNEQELQLPLELVMVKDRLYVYSSTPVVINAADFGLDGGVEKLREVAGLANISTAVPVTFSLQFQRGS